MNPRYELPDLGGALRPVKSAVCRRVGGISRWRWRRTASREFRAFSHHHLTDIRPDRSRIDSTVEEIIETGGQPA